MAREPLHSIIRFFCFENSAVVQFMRREPTGEHRRHLYISLRLFVYLQAEITHHHLGKSRKKLTYVNDQSSVVRVDMKGGRKKRRHEREFERDREAG